MKDYSFTFSRLNESFEKEGLDPKSNTKIMTAAPW